MRTKNLSTYKNLQSATAILFYLVLAKLLIHFLTMSEYGFHRDEFLYLAMGERLDWGYLEVPPSIAYMAQLSRLFFGESLFAVRMQPVLSGALMVLFTGLLAREFGGKRFAQFLAALAVLISPAYLRSNMLFTPVVFDQLYWLLGAYLVVKAINSGDNKFWLAFGVLSGIALLNKYTMLLFGFGMLFGLLLTSERKMLQTPAPWQAAAIAFCIFLPNLIWQYVHGWPVVDHMQALGKHQFVHVQSLGFLVMQFLMNLFTAPIWILGIYFYFSKTGEPYRAIGWIYLVALIVLLLFSGKAYYLLPAYPLLFAGGAVIFENFFQAARQRSWLKPALVSGMIFGSAIFIPYGVPILPVNRMVQYMDFMANKIGLSEPLRWENGQIHDMPQEFADMFGWENQVKTVADVYRQLTLGEQAQCLILASNYGEAGAINYYRKQYDLPKAISFNGSYFLWGPGAPIVCAVDEDIKKAPAVSGDILITIGIPEKALTAYYHQVELAAIITHQYARENNVPVFICRGAKFSPEELWPKLSKFRF